MSPQTATMIAAAARRLLDQEGLEAVTMRRVAQAVGITAMAIYRHYEDRAALLNAVADQGFVDLAERIGAQDLTGKAEERLAQLGEVFLDYALENPRMHELMFIARREGARQYPDDFRAGKSPTANFAAMVLAEGMKDGEFREDDFWEINFEIGALSHGLIMLYLGGRIDATPEEFRSLYRRSFRRYIHGLLAEK